MDAKVDQHESRGDETARTNGLWAATLDAASEGMLVTDHRGNIILVNRAYTEITGYRADEVIGMNPRVLRSGRHDDAFYDAMWSALRRDGRWQGEIWNKRKDGETYPSWLSISSIKDANGRITNFLGIFADISIIKRHSSSSPIWPTMIR
ncbi:MAG: PAS domain S-box protein [Chromatiaceae bacterium]|nr:PAS domain S-box protein [Chromatiaceae bacterium]